MYIMYRENHHSHWIQKKCKLSHKNYIANTEPLLNKVIEML